MKELVFELIQQAIQDLQKNQVIPNDFEAKFQVDRTKNKAHGDFATNAAMTLTKMAKRPPREVAQMLIDALPNSKSVEKVEIAGPGFINFFLTSDSHTQVIPTILGEKSAFGRSNLGTGQKVHIEYVSANPTGPLHVGHGRGAAFGATLSNLLRFSGYEVHREYYVNDAGRQMHILAASVWLRYLEALGEPVVFPSNGYKGDYIHHIAQKVKAQKSESLRQAFSAVLKDVVADEQEDGSGDKEAHIDGIIENAKHLLGNENYRFIFNLTLQEILEDIKEDLLGFGVEYDEWFSEQSLMDSQAVAEAVSRLEKQSLMYEQEGAQWFKSTQFEDDKDRVVIRANGQTTYFASDIAYHMNKLDRGNGLVIDVLGADHHGYIPRVKAAMQALGANPKQLHVPLIQFVSLYRGGEKVQMSTRSGSFVTLKELREEIGSDAARFFYVMRKADQAMDFDLDLAKTKSNENPLYYIQYAHARICSAVKRLPEEGYALNVEAGLESLDLLTSEHAKSLMTTMAKFPEVIAQATKLFEPHLVVHYLRDLANHFHSYYNEEKCIVEENELRNARFTLILATAQVIKNGLTIIGVSAPESM
ncbi:MAG: arginine--tRNA ligase [Pseudomonadota bacterium]